jgi:hypothetical protein
MTNKFKEKQALAELLEKLYRIVDEEEDGAHKSYEIVGQEQAKDWRTGELQWEDEEHTIPKMTGKWDYVVKDDEELCPEDLAKIKACQYVKAQLEKML